MTGDQAIKIAVERARRFGAGLVAVRHGFHFGTARRFALKAAEGDCIGIVMCNTRPLMPAPGGAERVVGNNPIAIAVPSGGPAPIVLDMATSEAAMGKIRMAEKAGEKIPGTWAVKADGSATTDPAEAIAGMLLPASGPKGFGLAFLIDLLCGVLSGGAAGSAVQPLYGNASDALRLLAPVHRDRHRAFRRPRRQCGRPRRPRQSGSARARVRPVSRALFTPGEPEWVKRENAAGQVMLPSVVAETLLRLATELRVPADPLAPSRKIRKDLKMAKREVKTDKIRTPSGVFSQATVIEAQGRLVFISGMTARRPDGTIAGIGDITAQTRQVCENIKSAVEAAGGTLDDVCRVDVYVRNMEHFKEIHAVRQEYFKPPLPASTMVEICKMTSPDYLIEINAIAVIPTK